VFIRGHGSLLLRPHWVTIGDPTMGRSLQETSPKNGVLGPNRPVLDYDMHLYGQYCPVARAAEILADRWTVLIIRELLADVNHFNELERGLPHMSRTLLTERLRRLEQAGVLERRGGSRGKRTEYRLTTAGRELQPIIDLFGEWGARWAFGPPRQSELDPIILLWWMRRAGGVRLHFAPTRGRSV
jgi:DNA-binding HxlR family transcriptional regulator